MRWLRAAVAGLAATAVAGVVWLGFARARDPGPPFSARDEIERAVAAGKHVRIDGPHGPVHVWVPPGYHADTGATVLYVHGYYDDADAAWAEHQLPQQFALSALNAVFVAPDAPTGSGMAVNYPDLSELLRLVEDQAGVLRGAALTAVVGHSGAYRTIEAWLDEPLLDHVTMVDALYGDEDLIARWLRASSRRRLITVGEDTLLGTESLAQKLASETYTLDRFPPSYELWPPAARSAKHLYVRAQYAHMPLVTEGIVLPSLLRMLPVERLPDTPWKLPLGSLPPLPDAAVDAAPGD